MYAAVFGRLTAVLAAVGTGWILFLMVLICADVLGRDLFSQPIPGVPEMVSFSIVGIVFLQLAKTLRSGGLTRSDVILAGILKRRPRIGFALEFVFALIGAAVFAIIARTTWPLAMRAYQDGDYFGNIGVIQLPVWALKSIVILGAVVMSIQFLLNAAHAVLVVIGKRAPSPLTVASE